MYGIVPNSDAAQVAPYLPINPSVVRHQMNEETSAEYLGAPGIYSRLNIRPPLKSRARLKGRMAYFYISNL
jgi:hypothetical protein